MVLVTMGSAVGGGSRRPHGDMLSMPPLAGVRAPTCGTAELGRASPLPS